ncbi:MAG: hypothetical protein IBJ16_00505 [Chitinophagaceae bacterium]|nr:hypothetical protein [Chitinophagaceae bacterium]
MQHKEEIRIELTSIVSSAIAWPIAVPYKVPVGYFDALSEMILERIGTRLPHKVHVFEVPMNYFEQLPDAILQAVRHADVNDELQQIAPFLQSIPKTNPYQRKITPVLDIEAIMDRKAESDSGKVIAMPATRKNLWMRYVAAAVMIGVLVTVAFIYNGNQSMQLVNTDQYAKMDVSNEISKLSEDELTNYLSSAEKLMIAVADRETLLIDELPDVNDHLDYMSDDELDQYLQESTESASTETVGTNS